MNDGKQPKRSIIGFIFPYIITAIGIVLLIWFFTGHLFGGPEIGKLNTFDEDFLGYGFSLKADPEDPTKKVPVEEIADYGLVKKRIISANIREGEKAVEITGEYYDENQKGIAYSVEIEASKFTSPFETVVKLDDDIYYTVTHKSYQSLFKLRTSEAKIAFPKANTYYNVEDAFAVGFWEAWGPTILYVGITLLIGIFIVVRMNRAMNGASNSAMTFNKSPARRADNTKVRFEDVAGCDEEKAEMVELVAYLKDPKKFSRYGARLPKGVLMIGPPGTGKTLLAKAVAGEAGVPFYSISGSDFVEMYVGVGAGRVRDLFRKAKETAPCLIFIDEIDAVGRQRGAGLGGGNDEREQTLNQLLVEMDGFEANSGILVIAATNRDDVLDPALRRAGRFDRTITVSLPDKEGREAILKVHARNKKIDPSVDFAALAKRTVGFSGADLESILNDAAILAVRGNKPNIGTSEIDEAIDRRISGPAKKSRSMSEHERRQISFHEAGHAVIGIHVPYSDKVQKITIVPRGNTGGHVLMTPENDRFLMTKNELLARITGYLGGRTSEEIFFKDVSTGASNDIEVATRIARAMVTEYGMSDLGPIQYERDTGSVFLGRDYASTQKNFSTQVAFEIDKAVREIVDSCHDQAFKILTEYKHEVEMIAETLLEKETITAEEVEYLVKHGTLPPVEKPVPEPEKPAETELNAGTAEISEGGDVQKEAPKTPEEPPKEEASKPVEEPRPDEGDKPE